MIEIKRIKKMEREDWPELYEGVGDDISIYLVISKSNGGIYSQLVHVETRYELYDSITSYPYILNKVKESAGVDDGVRG